MTAVITRSYTGFLGRAPDPAGLNGWVDLVVTTGNVEGAAGVFLIAPEFEQQALTFRDYVTRLCRGILGRDGKAAGLDGWEAILRAHLVVQDPMLFGHRARLAGLAVKRRLPRCTGSSEHVAAGGLMAYAANRLDLFRPAAGYVARILKGARPGDRLA